jgi:VWFA-related protein
VRKIVVGVAVACSIISLAAQDQPFRTGASYVRVDVFPTAKGAPVTDLTSADFEVLEDKVPQTIASFEHVVVRGRMPDAQMQEPRTVAESRDAVANGRGRVFVVFLDSFHVEATDSTRIRRPLTSMLDRALGPDDLIGLYRPGFTPADLTFTPKHATVEGAVASMWGQRDTLVTDDPSEDAYRQCYPAAPSHCAYSDCRENGLGIADDMIQRRRESRTLASLRDLVAYLGGTREERKAVLVVTDGWRLLTPNPDLERPIPGVSPSGTRPTGNGPQPGARGGLFSTPTTNPSTAQCERDRYKFAEIDDAREAVKLQEDANRANVSFYPIDPRGLAAYDESPVANAKINMLTGKYADPEPAVSPRGDLDKLTARVQSLRALAESTDGVAVVETNNLGAAMQKVADDLSSYYLIGYNSSGKMDGKFHAITVRVKRPGVDIRARRGFRAYSR